jgi:hypothetical protein
MVLENVKVSYLSVHVSLYVNTVVRSGKLMSCDVCMYMDVVM